MTDAVMISIRPKWCELIAQGKKTCELRKNRPRIETPFKCFVYMTKGKPELIMIERDGDEWYGTIYHGPTNFITLPEGGYGWAHGKRGKVIGEFICDAIAPVTFDADGVPTLYYIRNATEWRVCVTVKEARKYCGDTAKKGLFAWHISNFVLYDTPKELKQYQIPTTYPARGIRRPPQSWIYAEELTE